MPISHLASALVPGAFVSAGLLLGLAALGWTAGPGVAAGPEQPPGERFTVRPDQLPRPYATPSAGNPSRQVARPAGAGLNVPAGFVARLFADDLEHPRYLLGVPNGDVLLAESAAGRITVLRDADGDGRAEQRAVLIDGLRRPHGLALRPGWLYVADTDRVWRVAYTPGDLRARAAPEPVTPAGALGPGSGHWTRNIAFHPDGSRFYVAIGSRSNIDEEEPPRAAILEFDADGERGPRVFATGLRNPVGIAYRPGSAELWSVINERDGLGDGLVPDYFTRVIAGGFYGWPYSYIGQHPQPGFAERRLDLVARAIVPDLLFQAHSAPIGLVFYDAQQFPAEYRGDAFVALRGSWNARRPTGYYVARVKMRDGRPVGHYETFASGFWIAGADTAQVWGRPAALAVAADGALLIGDDTGRTVWRVVWQPGGAGSGR